MDLNNQNPNMLYHTLSQYLSVAIFLCLKHTEVPLCAVIICSHSWTVASSHSGTVLLEGSSGQGTRYSRESCQSDGISGSAACLPTDGVLLSLIKKYSMQRVTVSDLVMLI